MSLNRLNTSAKNPVFWVVLFIAFFYQIYRYPFEYGIEPPLPWVLGKYLLITGACLCVMERFFVSTRRFGLFELAFILLFLMLLVGGVWQKEKFEVQAAFAGLAALWVVLTVTEKIPYSSLRSFLLAAWSINVLFYVIQFFGILFFQKTFVHSSDSILTSRFGGMLVEPLGAPYLSFLFLGFAFEYKGLLRRFIAGTSMLTLVMSMTLTAGLFIFLVLMSFVIYQVNKRIGKVAAISIGFLTLLCVLGAFLVVWVLSDTYPYFAAKWEISIVPHAIYWWPNRWPLLPLDMSSFSETWWVFCVQNMGIVWTVAYLSVMYVLIKDVINQKGWLLKQRVEGTYRGLYVGIYLSGAYVLFGSLNQLYPAMYPVGLLFMIFAFMVKYQKIGDDTITTVH